jgi:hypothetical protein
MKFLYYLLVLILFAPIFSSAQGTYKHGYIVGLKGDTIKGFIEFKKWEKNPDTISFKKELHDSPIQTYTVLNAKAFGLKGIDDYRRYTINISLDHVDKAKLKIGIDTNFVAQNVFLLILTTGNNVTLFSYADSIKTRYYISESMYQEPRELAYRVYYQGNTLGGIQTDTTYRNQFRYLALKYKPIVDTAKAKAAAAAAIAAAAAANQKVVSKAIKRRSKTTYKVTAISKSAMAKIQSQRVAAEKDSVANADTLGTMIAKAKYVKTDLLKIAKAINGDVTEKFDTVRHWWSAGLVINDNILSLKGPAKFPNSSSIFPKISFGYNVFLNKKTERMVLRTELSLTANKYSFPDTKDTSGATNSLSKIRQYTFSVAPQLIYNVYNTIELKAYINLGVSANLSAYNKYTFTRSSSDTTIVSNKYPKLSMFWFNVPIKAGVVIDNHYEFYLGYAFSTTVTSGSTAYIGKLKEYELGFNYYFGFN